MEKIQGNNIVEKTYFMITQSLKQISSDVAPYCRRFLRFIALPYCYFITVNWDECKNSRYQVVKDLLYIFFKLKYYPDNYSRCRLWEKNRRQWHYYYGSIYDAYQRGRLRKEVQRKEYKIIFEDKNICYQLCKAANLPLPQQYDFVDPTSDYKSLFKSIAEGKPKKRLIIKPIRGKGGKDITLAYKDNNEIVIQCNERKILLDEFSLAHPSVIQECIEQHEALCKISQSVNTVRIVTFLTKEKNVIVIGAYMRFGIDNAYVDNVSSGGISVGIDIEKGVLQKVAYDQKSRQYYSHPTTQFIFKEFRIPYWSEVIDLAKKIQYFFFYYKFLGNDIAITPHGPVIIEINGEHDNVGLEQKCGPILANEKVRNEFMKYDLLINKLSNK